VLRAASKLAPSRGTFLSCTSMIDPDRKYARAPANSTASEDARIGRIFALSVAAFYGLMMVLYGLGL